MSKYHMLDKIISKLKAEYELEKTGVLKRRFVYFLDLINKKTERLEIPKIEALRSLRDLLNYEIEKELIIEYRQHLWMIQAMRAEQEKNNEVTE